MSKKILSKKILCKKSLNPRHSTLNPKFADSKDRKTTQKLLKICKTNGIICRMEQNADWNVSYHNYYLNAIYIGLKGKPSKIINSIIAHELSHALYKHFSTETNILRNEVEAWKKAFQLLKLEENFDRDTLEFAQGLLNEYFFNYYDESFDNLLVRYGYDLKNIATSQLRLNGVTYVKRSEENMSEKSLDSQISSFYGLDSEFHGGNWHKSKLHSFPLAFSEFWQENSRITEKALFSFPHKSHENQERLDYDYSHKLSIYYHSQPQLPSFSLKRPFSASFCNSDKFLTFSNSSYIVCTFHTSHNLGFVCIFHSENNTISGLNRVLPLFSRDTLSSPTVSPNKYRNGLFINFVVKNGFIKELEKNQFRKVEKKKKRGKKMPKSLKEQRDLWNTTEMRVFLKYRAKDGSTVTIFRPKSPKPLKRVI